MSFTNLNQCASFTQTVGALSAQPLSSATCSEVYIYNHSSADVFIFTPECYTFLAYCSNSPTLCSFAGQTPLQAGLYFRLQTLNDVTIRGITDSGSVSAMGAAGTPAQISYRPQYFSFNPLNTY